jgi:hypothetical protein
MSDQELDGQGKTRNRAEFEEWMATELYYVANDFDRDAAGIYRHFAVAISWRVWKKFTEPR